MTFVWFKVGVTQSMHADAEGDERIGIPNDIFGVMMKMKR